MMSRTTGVSISRASRAAVAACARLMASTEPWITLRRDSRACLAALDPREKELYLARRRGRIVGFVCLNMRGAFAGYIQSIAVEPRERGRGLGTALIRFAERRILTEKPNVFLCVSSFNPRARRLYERLGYQRVGALKDYVVEGHSEVLMRKTTGPLNPRKPSFAFLPAATTRRLLLENGSLDDWDAFVRSWEDMPVDRYMADGGRYRRRRHAVFVVQGKRAVLQRRQPHYQSRDYNVLNGGVRRWFAPISRAVAAGDSLRTILRFCSARFEAWAGEPARWRVEAHQFRIEARHGKAGKPTPEGLHRDGVDYVLALLVKRENVRRGRTLIADPRGRSLGGFTLREPLDVALLDDAQVHHGVTPIQPLDPSAPAYRDVLVVTFRRLS